MQEGSSLPYQCTCIILAGLAFYEKAKLNMLLSLSPLLSGFAIIA